MLLWMEHVLGFERLLGGRSSTPSTSTPTARPAARGCKSVVMWDPESQRQVRQQRARAPVLQGARRSTSSTRSYRGDGVQHVALRGRRHPERGARPARDAASTSCPRRARTTTCCPQRIKDLGIGQHRRGHRGAARAGRSSSMARATTPTCCRSSSRSSAGLYGDPDAGPFFYRDHPAQGRPRLRRRQLPRAVREHRARSRRPRGA